MTLNLASKWLGKHRSYLAYLKKGHPEIIDIVSYKGSGNLFKGMRLLKEEVNDAKLYLQSVYFDLIERRKISKLYRYMEKNNIYTGYKSIEAFRSFMCVNIFNIDTRVEKYIKIIYLSNVIGMIIKDFKKKNKY